MDQATTLATLKQAIAALYAPQTTQRTRQEADAFLQAFVRSGFGACLEPCGALLDDPASSRAELLFAAHATHRTVRHCVFKPGAAQRPQRATWSWTTRPTLQVRAPRAAGEGPGPLLTQHALALAAVFLKDEDPADVVARVVAALRGNALLETLRVLPEELDELSIKPQLRAARRAAFTTSAPAALAAALDHAAGAAAACYRAAAERRAPTISRRRRALARWPRPAARRGTSTSPPRPSWTSAERARAATSRGKRSARCCGPLARGRRRVAAAAAEAWAVVADADAAPGFLVACCGRRSFRHVAYDDDAAGDDDDAVERDARRRCGRGGRARDRDGALLAVLATPEPSPRSTSTAPSRGASASAPVFDGLLRFAASRAPDGPDARPYAVSCCLAMSAAPDARFGDAAAHFLARSDAVVARRAIAPCTPTETRTRSRATARCGSAAPGRGPPSARLSGVAAAARAARPAAADLYAALAPVGAAAGGAEDPLVVLATTLAGLVDDEKGFKKLLKQALGGKRKGRSSSV
ncbi:hypothetical protein JL720_15731 [Aureococcus anophagefferens]|nr:hypothetical protein JL720_15731 [Aureococcus anophagefferens]